MLDSIRQLIGQSKTREALDALTEFLRNRDRDLHTECIGHQGRFNHLATEKRKNVIESADFNIELNRINFALLDILQQAEREFPDLQTPKKPQNTEGANSARSAAFTYDVFLSFSNQEREAAYKVFEKLTQAGLKTFFSSESLRGHSGQSFSRIINNALENSQHFLLFCSPAAMASNWVELEWETFYNEFSVNDPTNRRFFILKGIDFQQVRIPLILRRLQYANAVEDIISVFDREDLAKLEADKRENDRLNKIEADKRESDRLNKIEADKRENERLNKIETDKRESERLNKIETDKRESDRLNKIEADKRENERLNKIEADKRESERLNKIEADKRESERLNKIEADKKAETERLAKIKADKKETERLAKIEADKKAEAERLAKIKADKKEAERLAKIEAAKKAEVERKATQLIENQRNTEGDKKSVFQKYGAPIIGGGLVSAGLLMWQLFKPAPETPPSVILPNQEPQKVEQPIVTPPTNTTVQGSKTINPKNLPNGVIVGKAVDKPKTDPSVLSDAAKRVLAQAAENERLAQEKRERDAQTQRDREAESERQRTWQTTKTRVLGYLNSAKAAIGSKDKSDALSDLNKAINTSGLPKTVVDALKNAKAAVSSEDYDDAKAAVQEAIAALK